jgi:hypothetical protein
MRSVEIPGIVQATVTGSRRSSVTPASSIASRVACRRRFLAFIDDAGDGFQQAVPAGGVEDGGAQLPHQHAGAPLRIIGQHARRLAMVLDLARDHLAVGAADLRPQQPDPAVIEILDIDDLARH